MFKPTILQTRKTLIRDGNLAVGRNLIDLVASQISLISGPPKKSPSTTHPNPNQELHRAESQVSGPGTSRCDFEPQVLILKPYIRASSAELQPRPARPYVFLGSISFALRPKVSAVAKKMSVRDDLESEQLTGVFVPNVHGRLVKHSVVVCPPPRMVGHHRRAV